ncbi:hypothetical protein SO574_14020 [Vibrio alfacsensis]|uniref:hypothetical protein n=1 Tax=Vibrio alfacsensis TaxID=1074311 RepID=UPI002ADD8A49|nr:hypothetical protein [Vibrio alfacsensis]WQE78278.1 hypothetical protein SO574_14020 [Vibrio alfacsensis]
MDSLDQRDKSLTELQIALDSLFHFGMLEPADYLNAGFFRSSSWYESPTDEYWTMNNGDVLFEDQVGCWVDRVKLVLKNKNTDIKLIAYPVTGNAFNIPVSGRNASNDNEEVTFVISRAVNKVALLSNDSNLLDTDVIFIRIEGVKINALTDTLNMSKVILNTINSDVKAVEKTLDKEVIELKKSIENLNEKKKTLSGKIASFEIQESQAKVKLESMDEQISQQEKFLYALNKRLDKSKTELDELQEKHNDVESEKNSLESSKAELTKQLVTKTEEIKKVQAVLERYKHSAGLFSEDFSTLKLSVLMQNMRDPLIISPKHNHV